MSIFSKLFPQGTGHKSVGTFAHSNPALEYLRLMPPEPTNEALIKALPVISLVLRTEAENFARLMQVGSPMFIECVLDLELFGSFSKILEATESKELASAYVDAIVFEATGKTPSIAPTESEFRLGGTENYRGIAKYAEASKHYSVPSPQAWLFGKEYSTFKTRNTLDFAYVGAVRPMVPHIVETGMMPIELASELSRVDIGSLKTKLSLEEAVRMIDPEKANEWATKYANRERL